MQKEIWLINGIPGSGKTTTAKALAKRFTKAAHIEGDSVQDLIVSGKVSPGQEPKEEESKQIHLCVTNQCLLAASYVNSGFIPVIDYVIVNKQRVEEYRRLLQGHTIYFVTLNPGIEEALDRDRNRPEKTVAHVWTHLEEQIKKELSDTGLWVDNSNMGLEQTVDFILKNKDKSKI